MPFFKEKDEPIDVLSALIDVITGVSAVAAIIILIAALEYVRGA